MYKVWRTTPDIFAWIKTLKLIDVCKAAVGFLKGSGSIVILKHCIIVIVNVISYMKPILTYNIYTSVCLMLALPCK